MKDIVEELNHIHNRIAELRDRINDFYQDIGSGNSVGREIRDELIKGKIEDLIKEQALLIARLKKIFK